LRVELWVAHTVSVGLEIVKAATCFLRARDLAANGMEQLCTCLARRPAKCASLPQEQRTRALA
jgi:hypothetical protein